MYYIMNNSNVTHTHTHKIHNLHFALMAGILCSYPLANIQMHFNHTADVNGDDGS